METTDVRNLVTEVLRSLKQPNSEHVIDEVFYAIESSTRWHSEYDGLCLKHSKTTVNSLGGYWIGRTLGKHGKKQVPSKQSKLIGSYSLLDTDDLPRSSKPKEPEARELMAQYWKIQKSNLPPADEMKKHRETLVELIMDGATPEEAFNIVLHGVTPG